MIRALSQPPGKGRNRVTHSHTERLRWHQGHPPTLRVSFLPPAMTSTEPLHVQTPVRDSPSLSKVAGTRVYLKMDSAQPSGSFKIRGIGHLCRTVQDGLRQQGGGARSSLLDRAGRVLREVSGFQAGPLTPHNA